MNYPHANPSLIRNIAAAALLLTVAGAARGQKTARDLTEASLEDLMNVEVTTVSRKQQKLSQSPAAVYVITQEDIRRSGAANIPDLLRMVPGLQVAQIQGSSWAVSARGFNDQFSNKMLVLVDGRSAYSSNDSGVFWELRDTLLADIERIEVVRGPGATLWGANAVNGVINIITKPAAETQGALVSTGIGDQGQSLGAFRYGGTLGTGGETGRYRAFTQYSHGRGLSGSAAGDPDVGGASTASAGFRADWSLRNGDSLSAEGGVLRSNADSDFRFLQLTPPFTPTQSRNEHSSDGNVQLLWRHRKSARSQIELHTSFDRSERQNPFIIEGYSMVDVDFQHEVALSASNDLVWGLGFRESLGHSTPSFDLGFLPANRNDPLFSAFLQDQWTLPDGHFSLILGSKFEHNNFTGVEIQPSARLLWIPDAHHTAWAAISRAVRSPFYSDSGLRLNASVFPGPGGAPTIVRILGNPSLHSEDLLAYELGYRLQTSRRFSFDLAAFYNTYSNLKTVEPGTPFFEAIPGPAHLVLPSRFENQMSGKTYGTEIAFNWNVTERWRLMPGYSWLVMNLQLDPASRDIRSFAAEGQSPRHQAQLRSNLDLTRRLQFDASIFYTGALPAFSIPAYTRVDARLGYRPRPDLEISVTGQNLQGGRHEEFYSSSVFAKASIGRSFMTKVTFEF